MAGILTLFVAAFLLFAGAAPVPAQVEDVSIVVAPSAVVLELVDYALKRSAQDAISVIETDDECRDFFAGLPKWENLEGWLMRPAFAVPPQLAPETIAWTSCNNRTISFLYTTLLEASPEYLARVALHEFAHTGTCIWTDNLDPKELTHFKSLRLVRKSEKIAMDAERVCIDN